MQMANRYVKKMFNATNDQRNANQNQMRHHLTIIRMIIIQDTTDDMCLQDWRQMNFCIMLVEYKLVIKNTMEGPQKIKNRII